MDSMRTEAIIARMRRDGWDITSNAYKYEFPGVFVSADAVTKKGNVFISKGAPGINLDLARRIASYLEGLDGITNVTVTGQRKNGDIMVEFGCADFWGSWTA